MGHLYHGYVTNNQRLVDLPFKMVMFHRFFWLKKRLGSDLELNDTDPHGRIIVAVQGGHQGGDRCHL